MTGYHRKANCPNRATALCVALDGRLKKATRLKGIEGFRAADNGLVPMAVDTWGQLVFVNMAAEEADSRGVRLSRPQLDARMMKSHLHCHRPRQPRDSPLRAITLKCSPQPAYQVACDYFASVVIVP